MIVARLFGIVGILAYCKCIFWEYTDYEALIAVVCLIIYYGENLLNIKEHIK